jgi:nucleotide-binding universal stress UspA family protein
MLEASGGTGIFVYVVEKAGGAPDKASVEQREAYAERMFHRVRSALAGSSLPLETDIRYGTEVGETIIEAAHDHQANGIAFTPRGGSRWVKLLTGDVTGTLIATSDLPVLVLPEANGAAQASFSA